MLLPWQELRISFVDINMIDLCTYSLFVAWYKEYIEPLYGNVFILQVCPCKEKVWAKKSYYWNKFINTQLSFAKDRYNMIKSFNFEKGNYKDSQSS